MEEQTPETLRKTLDIIHDKALAVSNMLLEDNVDLDKVRSGVDLIESLARYGFDIRSSQERQEMEQDAEESDGREWINQKK